MELDVEQSAQDVKLYYPPQTLIVPVCVLTPPPSDSNSDIMGNKVAIFNTDQDSTEAENVAPNTLKSAEEGLVLKSKSSSDITRQDFKKDSGIYLRRSTSLRGSRPDFTSKEPRSNPHTEKLIAEIIELSAPFQSMRRSSSTCGINDIFNLPNCDLISYEPVINDRIHEDRKPRFSQKRRKSTISFINSIIDDVITDVMVEVCTDKDVSNGHCDTIPILSDCDTISVDGTCDISVDLTNSREHIVTECSDATLSEEDTHHNVTLSEDDTQEVTVQDCSLDTEDIYVSLEADEPETEIIHDSIRISVDDTEENNHLLVDETSEFSSRLDSNASSIFSSIVSEPINSDEDEIPFDSCPSDDSTDEFDGAEDKINYSFNHDRFHRTVPARRDRFSVTTPPNITRNDAEIFVPIKKYKSESTLNVLRDEFVEHLKTLTQRSKMVRSPSSIKLEVLQKDALPMKGHRRVNSQTITKEEIDIVKAQVKDKKTWDFHKMANKSKLAHAILFIGARYAAIAQDKFSKMQTDSINSAGLEDECDAGTATRRSGSLGSYNRGSVGSDKASAKEKRAETTSSEKGSKIKGARSTTNIAKESSSQSLEVEPKKRLNRAFSFSFKPKSNLSKANSSSTASLIMRPSDSEIRRASANDVSLFKKRGSTESEMQPLAEEELLRARRCLSWQELSIPAEETAAAKGPRKAVSSEGLSPGPDLKNAFTSYSQVTLSQSALNRADSTNSLLEYQEESGSDCEDGKKRGRITRLKSLAGGKGLKPATVKRERKSVSFMKGKQKNVPHIYQSLEQEPGLEVQWGVCSVCKGTDQSMVLQLCTNCDFVAHKTCSSALDQCSHRDKEKKNSKNKMNRSTKQVALLNKRQPSTTDLREIPTNGCKRSTLKETESSSKCSDNRSYSISDSHNNIFRGTNRSQSPLPLESEEEFSESDSDTNNAWRETIDPLVLANMRKEEMKRQDHIHELITTERNHITNLKILIKVFKNKLQSKLNMSHEDCTNLFPCLEKLLLNCVNLYTQLKEGMLGQDQPDRYHKIGEILIQHFGPDTSEGHSMRNCYAKLSAQKTSAVDLYKEKCKDKTFREIAAYLESKKVCKRQTYSELILAVTMRLTKYPPMLEALVRATPASHPDHQTLKQAVHVVKDALNYINTFVHRVESQKVIEIYKAKLEIREVGSSVWCRQYRHFDLCSPGRGLVHEGSLTLKYHDKAVKVVALLFNDYLVILREKENKLQLSFDDTRTSPIVNLSNNCLVKNIVTDKTSFVVISDSKGHPQMYNFIADNREAAEKWLTLITSTIDKLQLQDTSTPIIETVLPEAVLIPESAYESPSITRTASNSTYDKSSISRTESIRTQSEGQTSDVESDSDSGKPTGSRATLYTNTTDEDSFNRVNEYHADLAILGNSFLLGEHTGLDRIEEKREFFNTNPISTQDHIREVERLQTCIRKCPSFNKRSIKEGNPARRATSLLLVERNKKDENRRHTTCLTQQELSNINNQYQSKTLQDNPVRQKSSDSGCCVEDPQQSVLNSMSVLQKALLHMLNKDKEQEDLIKAQADLIAQQKAQLDAQSEKISLLESKLVNTSSETNLLRSEVRLLTSRLDHSPVIRRHRSLNVVEELSDSQTSV